MEQIRFKRSWNRPVGPCVQTGYKNVSRNIIFSSILIGNNQYKSDLTTRNRARLEAVMPSDSCTDDNYLHSVVTFLATEMVGNQEDDTGITEKDIWEETQVLAKLKRKAPKWDGIPASVIAGIRPVMTLFYKVLATALF